MFVFNDSEFAELRTKVKDGVLDESLYIMTDLDEDISDIHVKGDVDIEGEIADVNFIPTKIEQALTIDQDISFAELNHDIYFGAIEVKGLLTTKGMGRLHLISEAFPELANNDPVKIKFYLCDSFNDDHIEYLPLSVINKNRLSENIFYMSDDAMLNFQKLVPRTARAEGLYKLNEDGYPMELARALIETGYGENYAYVYAANHLNEAVLDMI